MVLDWQSSYDRLIGEVATIIIAAHPINTAAHYRLFSRWGRWKYRQPGRDVPYVSDQEWVTLALTAAAVAGAVRGMW